MPFLVLQPLRLTTSNTFFNLHETSSMSTTSNVHLMALWLCSSVLQTRVQKGGTGCCLSDKTRVRCDGCRDTRTEAGSKSNTGLPVFEQSKVAMVCAAHGMHCWHTAALNRTPNRTPNSLLRTEAYAEPTNLHGRFSPL